MNHLWQTLREHSAITEDEAQFLAAHRLAGYAESQNKKSENDSPPILREHWQEQWYRNTILLAELERLGNKLHGQGMQATALKGTAWLDLLYEDRGSRFIADIDLLVPEPREAWDRFFINEGYTEFPSAHFESGAFTTTYQKKIQGMDVSVDLHFGKIFYDETPGHWRKENSAWPGIERLCKEDALVHFAGHIAFQNAFYRIDLLLDIDRLLRKFPDLDWLRVNELAKALKKQHALSAVLWCAKEKLGTPMPQSPGRSCLWRWLIRESYLLFPGQHRWRYYFLKHVLKDSLLEACWNDLRWLKNKLLGSGPSASKSSGF